MTTFFVLIALLVVLDLTALRWGVDSRLPGGDWRPAPVADAPRPRVPTSRR